MKEIREDGRRGLGADKPFGLEGLNSRAAEMLVLGVEQPAM
jgi:hypothetical protein